MLFRFSPDIGGNLSVSVGFARPAGHLLTSPRTSGSGGGRVARRERPKGRRKNVAPKRSRGSGHRPRTRRRAPAWLRPAAVVVLVVAFGAGFYASGMVVEADRTVRARFEGVRFEIPSRVYSAPMILYPGLDWQQIDLRGTFDRLGYRHAATSRAGSVSLA